LSRTVRTARRSLILLLVLGLAVHILLPQITQLRHSLGVVKNMAVWAVALALGSQALSYVGNGYVTRSLVELFGLRIPLSRSISITLASYSLGLVWGGQVTYTGATYRWLRSAGLPGEAALITGLVPALINVLTIGAVAAFGLVYLLAAHRLSPALATVFAMALALLLFAGGFVWWGMSHRAGLTRVIERTALVWSRLRHRDFEPAPIEATLDRLFRAWALLLRGQWRAPLLGDIANVGFDVLTLYTLFLASGYYASPGVVLAGYGLPLLAGKLSILPGGLGVVEGGMVALYETLGVPAGVSVVVILSYRLLSFWLPVLIGFPLAVVLDRQGRIASPEAQ
jgi:uncharacterized protein (TIRG00374 family)